MARRKIVLQGHPAEEAGTASGTITPGMLVEPTGDSSYRAHSTAAGAAASLWARERWEDQGKSIDDDIPSGGEVAVVRAGKGDKINALTDETIVRGEFVESAGGGKVRVHNAGVILGQAAEDSELPAEGNGRVPIIVI